MIIHVRIVKSMVIATLIHSVLSFFISIGKERKGGIGVLMYHSMLWNQIVIEGNSAMLMYYTLCNEIIVS